MVFKVGSHKSLLNNDGIVTCHLSTKQTYALHCNVIMKHSSRNGSASVTVEERNLEQKAFWFSLPQPTQFQQERLGLERLQQQQQQVPGLQQRWGLSRDLKSCPQCLLLWHSAAGISDCLPRAAERWERQEFIILRWEFIQWQALYDRWCLEQFVFQWEKNNFPMKDFFNQHSQCFNDFNIVFPFFLVGRGV